MVVKSPLISNFRCSNSVDGRNWPNLLGKAVHCDTIPHCYAAPSSMLITLWHYRSNTEPVCYHRNTQPQRGRVENGIVDSNIQLKSAY